LIRGLEGESADEALHRLRICIKKLRYTLELYGVVVSGDLRTVTRSARAIQDLLGSHQDACVAVGYGQRLALQLPLIPQNREVLVTLGRLQSERERQAQQIRRTFLAETTGRDFSRSLKRALKTL
jgi:CHAD domain-containing protein